MTGLAWAWLVCSSQGYFRPSERALLAAAALSSLEVNLDGGEVEGTAGLFCTVNSWPPPGLRGGEPGGR